jgi:hypothetical protein
MPLPSFVSSTATSIGTDSRGRVGWVTMPRWWKDKEAYAHMMQLDRTMEALGGLTPELKALLLQWDAELVRLRSEPFTVVADGRVEVSESDG